MKPRLVLPEAGRRSEFDRSLDHHDAASAWRRYSVAALCVFGAFLFRYVMAPVLGSELPFLLFIAASLVSAWYGGMSAGLAALALGLILGDQAFGSMSLAEDPIGIIRLVRYIFTAALGIGLIEMLHRSRRRTEVVVERLAIEMDRRRHSEAALLAAEAQISRHAHDLEFRVKDQTATLSDTLDSLKNVLYFMVHNLRAPLRAMEGYTSLLLTDCASLGPSAKSYSQHICEAAKQMDLLLHALLSYGRLGHIEVNLVVVDLSQVLERALYRLEYELKATSAQVRLESPLPKVRASADVLLEVLINLVENAIRFVKPGCAPVVRIWGETKDEVVRLWIEDNGPGIDPRYHDRIFEAFETLSSSGGHDGRGMGLAIVKQGIQRMRGRAGVESKPSLGSRFWIELALARTECQGTVSQEAACS